MEDAGGIMVATGMGAGNKRVSNSSRNKNCLRGEVARFLYGWIFSMLLKNDQKRLHKAMQNSRYKTIGNKRAIYDPNIPDIPNYTSLALNSSK